MNLTRKADDCHHRRRRALRPGIVLRAENWRPHPVTVIFPRPASGPGRPQRPWGARRHRRGRSPRATARRRHAADTIGPSAAGLVDEAVALGLAREGRPARIPRPAALRAACRSIATSKAKLAGRTRKAAPFRARRHRACARRHGRQRPIMSAADRKPYAPNALDPGDRKATPRRGRFLDRGMGAGVRGTSVCAKSATRFAKTCDHCVGAAVGAGGPAASGHLYAVTTKSGRGQLGLGLAIRRARAGSHYSPIRNSCSFTPTANHGRVAIPAAAWRPKALRRRRAGTLNQRPRAKTFSCQAQHRLAELAPPRYRGGAGYSREIACRAVACFLDATSALRRTFRGKNFAEPSMQAAFSARASTR